MSAPVSIRDRVWASVAFIEERAPYAVFTPPPEYMYFESDILHEFEDGTPKEIE